MTCGKRNWSPAELIAFEQRIADRFLAKEIHCPIHLSGGNEQQLIDIFKNVNPGDWVLSTHRSHYHALLHGISPEWVEAEIMAGRSMHLNSPEHHFLTSAIVGGIAPIAVGIAMGLFLGTLGGADELTSGWEAGRLGRGKNENLHETCPPPKSPRVWCFLGDMAAEMGISWEAAKYAVGHQLSVHFVIEDNGLSAETPTIAVWGGNWPWPHNLGERYHYKRQWPHVGVGKWVTF